MREQLDWEEVYQSWVYGQYYLPAVLSEPVKGETISVECPEDGCYIYGYDWLNRQGTLERKRLIAEQPTEFLYFTRPTNKGTIHTAQMLIEAKDDAERAAIWIAATAFELKGLTFMGRGKLYAERLYETACEFLKERFELWHYAMRRLVPEIMVPYDLLECIDVKGPETIMHLIQINTLLIQGEYSILCYSSLKEGDTPARISVRLA